MAELEIHVLGKAEVIFRGKCLPLTPRMCEILCILVMYPNGITLETCHAALYGDGQVSTATLKAELSHLRSLLDGRLCSRVYRLSGTVWADYLELWQAIREGRLEDARHLYQGDLLPQSTSPEIREWRQCIAVVMGNVGRRSS